MQDSRAPPRFGSLARVLLGRTGERMSTEPIDLLPIIERGLGAAVRPHKVIVVGAGMAGLSAAYELKRAGHEVVLLEARQRVGGRVQTLREPFAPGLYAEAAAMRLPRAQTVTMADAEMFKLP